MCTFAVVMVSIDNVWADSLVPLEENIEALVAHMMHSRKVFAQVRCYGFDMSAPGLTHQQGKLVNFREHYGFVCMLSPHDKSKDCE